MVKEYWNERSSSWIKGRDKQDSDDLILKYTDYIQEFLSTDSLVLEVGCGTGRYSHIFSNVKRLYSFDFISDFVEVAKSISPSNAEVFVDDVTELKFNSPVDLIFTQGVLQHVEDIEFAIINLCNLNANDIILLESKGWVRTNDYQFQHDYVSLFKEFGYTLHHSFYLDDSLPYTMVYHFRRLNDGGY